MEDHEYGSPHNWRSKIDEHTKERITQLALYNNLMKID